MKMQRLAVALTAINLVLLLLSVAQGGRTTAQTVTPIAAERPITTSITLRGTDGQQRVISP